MMLMTLTVIPSRRMALETTPISRTPATTPCSLPRPPKIETPPRRTAAMTCSSRPVALSPGHCRTAGRVDAGERRDGAGQHEQQQLGAGHVDAGEARRLAVQPDVVDPRPNGEKWSRSSKTAASTTKTSTACGKPDSPIFAVARSVQ